MTYIQPNVNGQATMANSSPVVLASDQASIPVAATLAAETTKVIGVIRLSDGSGNLITSTSNALDVNIKGNVGASGVLSTNNSTTANLSGGAVFTGTGEDVLIYSEIRISVFSSHASASDGLSLQQSSDNTNWDITDVYTISATTGKTIVVPRQARYFRLVYTNGATLTTSLRIQTILNRSGSASSSQRPSDAYTNETDLTQQQSFLMGYNGTTWDRLRATTANGLAVDVTRLPTLASVTTVSTVTTLTGTTTLTPGTGATNLGKAEDAVHSSGDTGVFALSIGNEAQSTLAADGDYIGHAVDTKGNTLTTGNVLHDGVDAGRPLKIGGRARSSEIAAVSSDDRVDAIFDLVGKLIVLPYANPENFVSGAITSAMTSTTSTSLIASPGGSLRNYITQITVSNSHATVGTDVIIQDGSGGTTLYTIPAAAVYGGAVITFPTPLRQPTTATAIFCANVTTGASTKVSASGYKGL